VINAGVSGGVFIIKKRRRRRAVAAGCAGAIPSFEPKKVDEKSSNGHNFPLTEPNCK
jgi:hypothetical protein